MTRPRIHHHHAPLVISRRRFLLGAAAASLLTACDSDSVPVSETSDVATTSPESGTTSPQSEATPDGAAATLAGFDAFTDVEVTPSGDEWLVSSNAMPDHPLMVGITSWQQQVPLPQPYVGDNRWRLPMTPVMAAEAISSRDQLFRGAIALAVNGVPIFNALNNRGEDALLAGELDEFGGHCGRADDYHYHVAPLHLAAAVGQGRPIAYALDGYPIHGATEPDGSAVRELDALNGHLDDVDGYHYHGTDTYPYINGGLRGEVRVEGDQVEPQPALTPIRPAGEPLRGATITGFERVLPNESWQLTYELGGAAGMWAWRIDGNEVVFDITGLDGTTTSERFPR